MATKTEKNVLSLSYPEIQYGLMLIFLLLEVVWIRSSSLYVTYNRETIKSIIIALLIFLVPYLFYKIFRPDPRIVSLLESLFITLAFVQLMLLFSFLAATLNYPLIDSTLALVDSFFKINSFEVVSWFRAHNVLYKAFTYIYDCFLYQIPFVILYFSSRGDVLLLQRFIMQFMISSILMIIMSGLWPALGPYVWDHYTPSPPLAFALEQTLLLREGIVDTSKFTGIVTFPSFHTVMALIYIYTFRHERKLIFIPILLLNLLMIFSCLPIGEHYFADLVGAIPVFIATIWIDNQIYKYVIPKNITA